MLRRQTVSQLLTYVFQSSPAPEGRCYTGGRTARGSTSARFNPHRPRRAGATWHLTDRKGGEMAVSILTGPGGPVLLGATAAGRPALVLFQSSPAPEGRCYAGGGQRQHAGPVSILTGPGGPVLRDGHGHQPSPLMFQSSPAPEGRCYPPANAPALAKIKFQSSPAPEGRCYLAADLLRGVKQFQSSPAPEGRCYFDVPGRLYP